MWCPLTKKVVGVLWLVTAAFLTAWLAMYVWRNPTPLNPPPPPIREPPCPPAVSGALPPPAWRELEASSPFPAPGSIALEAPGSTALEAPSPSPAPALPSPTFAPLPEAEGLAAMCGTSSVFSPEPPCISAPQQPAEAAAAYRTLVVYAAYLEGGGAQYEDNLRFFVRSVLMPADPMLDYVFVVNTDNATASRLLLKSIIPPLCNVLLVFRSNSCLDVGGYRCGLAIACGINHVGNIHAVANCTRYERIILLNASVRGPHFPSYYKPGHWTNPFSQLITSDVKWAGCTINCDISPHVQSYLVVTDAVGLSVVFGGLPPNDSPKDSLIPSPGLFCGDYFGTVLNFEVAASTTIISRGFNLACHLKRAQGFDYRKQPCVNFGDPTLFGVYSGMDLHPLESVFTKYKPDDTRNIYSSQNVQKVYSEWLASREGSLWQNREAEWRREICID